MLETVLKIHELNVSHKEINPSNFIFSKKDKIWKLNDFGVSIRMQEKEKLEEVKGDGLYQSAEFNSI